jgi:putative transcriptional regulator
MDYFTSDKWVEPERGDLLISEPYLPDPNFERTVVLLCEHDENGTFGFVLNRQSKAVFGEVK